MLIYRKTIKLNYFYKKIYKTKKKLSLPIVHIVVEQRFVQLHNKNTITLSICNLDVYEKRRNYKRRTLHYLQSKGPRALVLISQSTGMFISDEQVASFFTNRGAHQEIP